jgi:hypothetical protein
MDAASVRNAEAEEVEEDAVVREDRGGEGAFAGARSSRRNESNSSVTADLERIQRG